MRIRLWTLPLLVLVALQARAESSGGKQATPVDDSTRTVCFVQPTTGSHIKKRVCMTQAEYTARKKADQEAMMRLKSVSSAESQKGSGSLR
jgi:hypothetical protein